jgi:hypothetical protein
MLSMTMNLKPGQRIAGFPAIEVRHLLRRIRPFDRVTSKFVADALKISDDASEALVSRLVSLGFTQRVEPKQVEPDDDDRDW